MDEEMPDFDKVLHDLIGDMLEEAVKETLGIDSLAEMSPEDYDLIFKGMEEMKGEDEGA